MSSLQKFHRRTLVMGGGVKAIGSEAPVAGSGFYLGLAGDGTSYMYVAPKSTEVTRVWGSYKVVRNTTSTTDGVANTNTLYAFGNTTAAGHPAAYACKLLTTGGYNTWYLGASAEMYAAGLNRNATPFATSDAFAGDYYWTSTESSSPFSLGINYNPNISPAAQYPGGYITIRVKGKYGGGYRTRAIRRATV